MRRTLALKMSTTQRACLTASMIRAVSVSASVAPRTLKRFLIGEVVAPMCAARIVRALHDHGLVGDAASASAATTNASRDGSLPPATA